MNNQELKEKVNFIIFECRERLMTDEEKNICNKQIERLNDEIQFKQNEIEWIMGALGK